MVTRPGAGGVSDSFYVDTQYRLIHEDAEILVIDKPAPLAVHAVGAYKELNLQTLLQNDPRFADVPIKTVHRLDAETSGVLIIAKTYEAARFLGMEFAEGRVRKTYEAIVFGRPENPSGDITHRLGYDKSSGFQTVRIRDEENGEDAHTRYELIGSSSAYSRLRLIPLTGRTHQLRAHLALLGHPIVGDKIYVDLNLFARYVSGGLDPDLLERLKLPRLALHASEAAFIHPGTRVLCTFTAPLAPMLNEFVDAQGIK